MNYSLIVVVLNHSLIGEKEMSELISGKEALIALANGGGVIYINTYYKDRPLNLWGDAKECNIEQFLSGDWIFRLKPRTVTLNGVEVPAPFTAPENLDNSLMWYVLDTDQDRGYSQCRNPKHPSNLLGSWIHEEEIKQVVAALRQVFGS